MTKIPDKDGMIPVEYDRDGLRGLNAFAEELGSLFDAETLLDEYFFDNSVFSVSKLPSVVVDWVLTENTDIELVAIDSDAGVIGIDGVLSKEYAFLVNNVDAKVPDATVISLYDGSIEDARKILKEIGVDIREFDIILALSEGYMPLEEYTNILDVSAPIVELFSDEDQ